jgi:hypothetical protein
MCEKLGPQPNSILANKKPKKGKKKKKLEPKPGFGLVLIDYCFFKNNYQVGYCFEFFSDHVGYQYQNFMGG